MNAIEARGLRVEIDGRTLLHDVDIDLRRGEVLVLVGPNGAGKSTLLSALIGDMAPAAGTVTLHGAAIARLGARELSRSRAVLLQSNDVSFPFTVAEVAEMGRAPWRGHPLADDDEAVIRASLDDAEVAHLADRRTTTLSGGERARAALARTLAQATAVLVLDEPTAALDIRHQERVLRRARAHAAAGGAVLVVLHDLNLAAAYADRIAVLHDGRLRACDDPAVALDAALLTEVYGHPVRVVRPFDGEPPLVVPGRRGRRDLPPLDDRVRAGIASVSTPTGRS
ncbi:heme ABC transporter ATP-binding protein [Microbacterium rhizophilus]|uniref:heme ABC transporter ATP-binding protein n=1 Tax=Microbacterium rhizophilus TaxID=3138934 RepID=UPI0031F0F4A5